MLASIRRRKKAYKQTCRPIHPDAFRSSSQICGSRRTALRLKLPYDNNEESNLNPRNEPHKINEKTGSYDTEKVASTRVCVVGSADPAAVELCTFLWWCSTLELQEWARGFFLPSSNLLKSINFLKETYRTRWDAGSILVGFFSSFAIYRFSWLPNSLAVLSVSSIKQTSWLDFVTTCYPARRVTISRTKLNKGVDYIILSSSPASEGALS